MLPSKMLVYYVNTVCTVAIDGIDKSELQVARSASRSRRRRQAQRVRSRPSGRVEVSWE